MQGLEDRAFTPYLYKYIMCRPLSVLSSAPHHIQSTQRVTTRYGFISFVFWKDIKCVKQCNIQFESQLFFDFNSKIRKHGFVLLFYSRANTTRSMWGRNTQSSRVPNRPLTFVRILFLDNWDAGIWIAQLGQVCNTMRVEHTVYVDHEIVTPWLGLVFVLVLFSLDDRAIIRPI